MADFTIAFVGETRAIPPSSIRKTLISPIQRKEVQRMDPVAVENSSRLLGTLTKIKRASWLRK